MYYFKLIFILVFIVALCGCTILNNITDSLVGSYSGGLEKQTENTESQVFDYEIAECFNIVSNILKDMGAKILKKDIYKYSIVAIVFKAGMEEETGTIFDVNGADVGIFLTEEGEGKTKIKISCLSRTFLDYASRKIFSELRPRRQIPTSDIQIPNESQPPSPKADPLDDTQEPLSENPEENLKK